MYFGLLVSMTVRIIGVVRPDYQPGPLPCAALATTAIWRGLFVVVIGERQAVKPMDQRIEAFLADVLALEGEDENAIREGVRVALADCEQIFKAQEVNRRMKDKAAHACHVLYRARVVEEIRRRKGTLTADHLKLVLNAIEGPRFPQKDE
jgi:hypothetical protein